MNLFLCCIVFLSGILWDALGFFGILEGFLESAQVPSHGVEWRM